jgi:hypothetical protein
VCSQVPGISIFFISAREIWEEEEDCKSTASVSITFLDVLEEEDMDDDVINF